MSDKNFKDHIKDIFAKLDTYCVPANKSISFNKESFSVRWSHKDIGFGYFTFYMGEDDKIHCDGEGMSKDFIKAKLSHMVDISIMDDPSWRDK